MALLRVPGSMCPQSHQVSKSHDFAVGVLTASSPAKSADHLILLWGPDSTCTPAHVAGGKCSAIQMGSENVQSEMYLPAAN